MGGMVTYGLRETLPLLPHCQFGYLEEQEQRAAR